MNPFCIPFTRCVHYFLILLIIIFLTINASDIKAKDDTAKSLLSTKASMKEANKLQSMKSQPDVSLTFSQNDFLHGFLPTIYIILISELGDKTFFIAAILSVRNSRVVVYFGAMAALTTMTVFSALLGYAITVVPKTLTWVISGLLFAIFGIKMLNDAYHMSAADVEEEYNEVKEDLKKRDDLYLSQNVLETDPETGVVTAPGASGSRYSALLRGSRRLFYAIFTKSFVEAFILTFIAEWGDRSQISTIVIAATKNVYGVICGGVLGHAFCTGLAVVGGRFVSQRIPVKWLTFAGGVTFILFAILTFYGGPSSLS